jgi:hypothetical protein
MEKNKVVFYCLFFLFAIIPVYPVVANDGYCVRASASEYVGVTEKGGNNKGFTDRHLKNALSKAGWKPGYAWCSFFVKAALDDCDIPNTVTGWSPSSYNRKDVIFTDAKFYNSYSQRDVLVMSLSYQSFKKDKSRFKGIGHTGVVDQIGRYSIRTIEGNTNDAGTRDSRAGDGVYYKIRPLNKHIHITRWKKAK